MCTHKNKLFCYHIYYKETWIVSEGYLSSGTEHHIYNNNNDNSIIHNNIFDNENTIVSIARKNIQRFPFPLLSPWKCGIALNTARLANTTLRSLLWNTVSQVKWSCKGVNKGNRNTQIAALCHSIWKRGTVILVGQKTKLLNSTAYGLFSDMCAHTHTHTHTHCDVHTHYHMACAHTHSLPLWNVHTWMCVRSYA